MKKKMKEQEIERTAREMRERVSELEKQVDSLKQENKCQIYTFLSSPHMICEAFFFICYQLMTWHKRYDKLNAIRNVEN
jgi:hypothetical protein